MLLDLLIVYFIDRAFDRPIQCFGKLGLGFLLLAVAIFGRGLALKYAGDVTLIQTPLPLLAATIGLSVSSFFCSGSSRRCRRAPITRRAGGRPTRSGGSCSTGAATAPGGALPNLIPWAS